MDTYSDGLVHLAVADDGAEDFFARGGESDVTSALGVGQVPDVVRHIY